MSWRAKPSELVLRGARAWALVAALATVSLIVTWPLGAALGESFPGDYGDPVFVSWVMSWVAGRVTSGFDGLWNANIFFPEVNTLAFSEHFVGQTLLVLPVYWLSGNPILAYNLAFLLTFVLTGLGTYLLTRSLTGSTVAGYVAAFIAAFNEYRLVFELAHLHTLSIHWFAFALYGLHRYAVTDRRAPLIGAVVSLVLLNLSSIYYMAYCAPFVVMFASSEVWRHGRWRVGRVWLELWAAAAAVVVLTLAVLLPYLAVQERLGVQRTVAEVTAYSADLAHYRAALPGFAAALAAAVLGIAAGVFDRSQRWIVATLALLLALSVWLSLGPEIRDGGAPVDWPSVYRLLHEHVPGYDGLRVPARFASLFFVFLAVLAAFGVRAIERLHRNFGLVAAAALAIVFVLRAAPDRIPLNVPLVSEGLTSPPPAYLTPSSSLPAIYQAIDSLRPTAILVELPFGDPWYDIRYMFFSATHRRRMLNGYSGLFPPSFLARQRVLRQPLLDPGASIQAIGGATHVVVHRAAWPDDTGIKIGAWLESLGGTLIAEAEGAALYELPQRLGYADARPER